MRSNVCNDVMFLTVNRWCTVLSQLFASSKEMWRFIRQCIRKGESPYIGVGFRILGAPRGPNSQQAHDVVMTSY